MAGLRRRGTNRRPATVLQLAKNGRFLSWLPLLASPLTDSVGLRMEHRVGHIVSVDAQLLWVAKKGASTKIGRMEYLVLYALSSHPRQWISRPITGSAMGMLKWNRPSSLHSFAIERGAMNFGKDDRVVAAVHSDGHAAATARLSM